MRRTRHGRMKVTKDVISIYIRRSLPLSGITTATVRYLLVANKLGRDMRKTSSQQNKFHSADNEGDQLRISELCDANKLRPSDSKAGRLVTGNIETNLSNSGMAPICLSSRQYFE